MPMNAINPESRIILDRRQIITGAAAFGLSATFGAMPAMAQGAPKKGGTLRMGVEGGSASDSFDPRTYADSVMINISLDYYLSDPQLVLYPALAIIATVLAFTLVGEGLRCALA